MPRTSSRTERCSAYEIAELAGDEVEIGHGGILVPPACALNAEPAMELLQTDVEKRLICPLTTRVR